MKSLLKICLISASLVACKGVAKDDGSGQPGDSMHVAPPPDSEMKTDSSSGASYAPDPAGTEKETKRQIMLNLLSSKAEINKLRTEVSDSLAHSGLSLERRSLFVSTMRQLESSSDLVGKQLQDLLVNDLERSREKLGDIINRMKGSEQELAGMIRRLDKIAAYMQLATTLMQTLVPIPTAVSPSKSSKENR